MGGAVFMVVITDRSRGKEFSAWFQSQGIPVVLAALGRGTATTEILDVLGLESSEKVVFFLVAPRSSRLVRRAERELWLDVPGRGVLMTVPLSSIGGARAMEYLLPQGVETEESMEEKKAAHELIVIIARRGYTDLVMDAARSAGAAGGTAIHAKGTGTELARKFFGVSIAAEKELIFILTRAEDRTPIMKAVMAKAGMHTDAQAVAFSAPVVDLAGLRRLESEDD